jgi:hypothetical protein
MPGPAATGCAVAGWTVEGLADGTVGVGVGVDGGGDAEFCGVAVGCWPADWGCPPPWLQAVSRPAAASAPALQSKRELLIGVTRLLFHYDARAARPVKLFPR